MVSFPESFLFLDFLLKTQMAEAHAKSEYLGWPCNHFGSSVGSGGMTIGR
jgi:hypothetical protein